ncbi:hypothetical protein D3C79_968780 [compost metagenome]
MAGCTSAGVVAAGFSAGAGLSGADESQALSNASAQASNNPLLNMVWELFGSVYVRAATIAQRRAHHPKSSAR